MEIKSINRLCAILQVKKEYLFDLVARTSQCYRPHDMKKKNGNGFRHIDVPNSELKSVQKRINDGIIKPMSADLPEYIHGARVGRSIKSNALIHTQKEMLFAVDLKDCFPSIKTNKVYQTLKNFGCSNEVSDILAKLITKDGRLPQGCPTSAGVCNLVLLPMLERMSRIARKNNIDMSQYVDDIFFSGKKEDVLKITKPIIKIIYKYGFVPKNEKIVLTDKSRTMRTTGVVVNNKVSVGRKKIHALEREIINITYRDKIEYEKVLEERKNGIVTGTCNIERLYGKIANVMSINEQQGVKLKNKLNKKIKDLK